MSRLVGLSSESIRLRRSESLAAKPGVAGGSSGPPDRFFCAHGCRRAMEKPQGRRLAGSKASVLQPLARLIGPAVLLVQIVNSSALMYFGRPRAKDGALCYRNLRLGQPSQATYSQARRSTDEDTPPRSHARAGNDPRRRRRRHRDDARVDERYVSSVLDPSSLDCGVSRNQFSDPRERASRTSRILS